MLFLIEYDCKKGLLKTFKTFKDAEKNEANQTWLDLELSVNREHLGHEVVLLEASSENALRHTHGRYFDSLKTLANKISSNLKAA